MRGVRVCIPRMLCMALVLWLGLGLGRKPEERPEVEEGERDGAALLLGVLRGLLEVEQPRAGSCYLVQYNNCIFITLLHYNNYSMSHKKNLCLFKNDLSLPCSCCWPGSS